MIVKSYLKFTPQYNQRYLALHVITFVLPETKRSNAVFNFFHNVSTPILHPSLRRQLNQVQHYLQ